MSTPTRDPATPAPYESLEGLDEPAVHVDISAEDWRRDRARREWMMIGLALSCLITPDGDVLAVAAFSDGDDRPVVRPAAACEGTGRTGCRGCGADARRGEGDRVREVPEGRRDPAGACRPARVKKFKVDVFQHVTQVSKELAPTEVWSFAVNGRYHRGTGVSPPMVVTEGRHRRLHARRTDSSKAMGVTVPHSMDFHAAEVNPGKRYTDLAPGKTMHYRFVAKHPGVFMYHCATQPVLMHTGAGMVGMLVVKPKHLAPVDKELWMTQQEYYLGKPGGTADMAKMQAKKPDVIAFNGFANQYKDNPITVKKGERVRMYVLNAGPSIWSAFHVIGTVFDRTVVEGVRGHDSQTMNLAPSQGGWGEFTLDEEGSYPFVTHAFGDAVKGAIGVVQTSHAPKGAAGHDMGASSAAAAKADVDVTLGDMWVKASAPTVKAGRVTFGVKNAGATMHGFAIASTPVKLEGAWWTTRRSPRRAVTSAPAHRRPSPRTSSPAATSSSATWPATTRPGRSWRSRSPSSP